MDGEWVAGRGRRGFPIPASQRAREERVFVSSAIFASPIHGASRRELARRNMRLTILWTHA